MGRQVQSEASRQGWTDCVRHLSSLLSVVRDLCPTRLELCVEVHSGGSQAAIVRSAICEFLTDVVSFDNHCCKGKRVAGLKCEELVFELRDLERPKRFSAMMKGRNTQPQDVPRGF